MKRNNQAGQLIVEFVLSLTLWTILMSGLISLVQIMALRQRAHAAARLGTLLSATGRITDQTVQDEVHRYLNSVPGAAKVPWTIDVGRFTSTPASRFYRLIETRVGTIWKSWPVSERVVAQQEDKTT